MHLPSGTIMETIRNDLLGIMVLDFTFGHRSGKYLKLDVTKKTMGQKKSTFTFTLILFVRASVF